jgi:tRNA-specific 2-thiouridylase
MSRTIVALSGGVDSAVAALLLRDAGHEVEALFMTNWDEDETGYCTSAADFQDARRVCSELGIPLHRANFAAEYRDRVFEHFLDELRHGRTPNPDVPCNREIKFGAGLAYALRLGADRYATGHYARIAPGPKLLRGLDAAKDQSYFLHEVGAAELAHCEFPVGALHKSEVRRIARERGLPVFDKRDSTGICFVGERPFGDFVGGFLPARPGLIETPEGVAVGRHRGLERYTLGQRSGLGIGGRPGAGEEPWFVAARDPVRNVLIVVQGAEHPALYSSGLVAASSHWIAGKPPAAAFECTAKLRHRQSDVSCRVTVARNELHVHFDAAVKGAAPGQYVVLYAGEECLGGAAIMTLLPVEASCRTASRHVASSPSAAKATTISP